MSNDKTADLVTNVLDRHHLAEPTGDIATSAWVQCSCGEFVAGHNRWHAQIQAQRHIARALADEGLITPATLRKEFILRRGDTEPSHFRWVSDLEPSTDSKERSTMSDTGKPTTVKVVIPSEAGAAIGSAIGQAIIVVGDAHWSNSDGELIVVDEDGNDVARFAAGHWRYAQIIDGSEGGQ